jgi:DNA-binding XRE family transcriptional regulator
MDLLKKHKLPHHQKSKERRNTEVITTNRRSKEMSENFRVSLNELLKDPDFKKEYDALEPEFQIIRAILDGRRKKNLTQKQLSELTGINQADISKIEKGNANPSLKTLQRLAAGMDMNVKIEFVPNQVSL